jgi:formylglycine-generating enzyme required for sulfatase activity
MPKPGYENHPVVKVSWYGARAYARWLGKRLPTEAEWEKAARGGLVGQKYVYGDTISPYQANVAGFQATTPVGSYPPNGFGLYDMVASVWQWGSDWYDSDYYAQSPYFAVPRTWIKKINPGLFLLSSFIFYDVQIGSVDS